MTSTLISSSKKRKRSQEISFKVAEDCHPDGVGPVLASFPCISPPPGTAFQAYARKKPNISMDFHADMIIAGETDTVDFESTSALAGQGCQYLVALHNPETSSVTIYPTPISPVLVRHTVKALKSIPTMAAPTTAVYREARNALGDTFGTKKAKAAIRAEERNRVDVSAMEGVMSHVMDGIDKDANGLLNKEEAKELADANRLVPPFNMDAKEVGDIYPLHNVIPESEYKAISVSAFEDAKSAKDRVALLPSRRSEWCYHRIENLFSNQELNAKKRRRIIFYISAMLAFRRVTRNKAMDKDDIHKALHGVPSATVDSFITRFTEELRDPTKVQATSDTQTNLLTHMLALCLRVDRFAMDPTDITTDLSLSQSRVHALLRSMGCKIGKISERDASQLGVKQDDVKRAILTTPLTFPKIRTRRAGR
ncbi:RNA polymerase I associated factor, A49-like protein [Fistulina hepatica ATCC 64428]|uniref:RNA polymerase I associated factor, A49-like protein n=1 Tax=Fistulina hepatica ATCC 64428 TaxID=1128425 RepID=A0A0D7A9X8_9AGAR|nr:RNA polymerase I associated factor, A49-like protein [Fistulina hepatica ATCC 64428]